MRPLDRLASTWSDWFFLAPAERDSEFKEEILRLTRRGMVVAAVLGVLSVGIYLGYYLLLGRAVTYGYGTPRAVVLWDELLIIAASAALFAMSRKPWGREWGRSSASLLIVLVSAAMMFEDVAGGDVSFTTAYLSLALILAVGTLPFRASHTFFLGVLVVFTYVIFVVVLPPVLAITIKSFLASRVIYLLVLTSLMSVISALLYKSRHEQFQALRELRTAQAELIQSEKMASLGHVTAGIAHEIKNPLNFINNFAELNVDLANDLTAMFTVAETGSPAGSNESPRNLVADLQLNSRKILEQGKRADAIVRSMMLHARGISGERRFVKLNSLVDEHVTLVHSGVRSRIPDFTVEIKRDYDESVGELEVAPQEIGRVLINLLNNAFDAVLEKRETTSGFSPVVSISTRRLTDGAEVRVRDNAAGIASSVLPKVFEPFFTTKPAGKGTGLGLSISYDIVVNGHAGRLHVENDEGGGAAFVVTLPFAKFARG